MNPRQDFEDQRRAELSDCVYTYLSDPGSGVQQFAEDLRGVLEEELRYANKEVTKRMTLQQLLFPNNV